MVSEWVCFGRGMILTASLESSWWPCWLIATIWLQIVVLLSAQDKLCECRRLRLHPALAQAFLELKDLVMSVAAPSWRPNAGIIGTCRALASASSPASFFLRPTRKIHVFTAALHLNLEHTELIVRLPHWDSLDSRYRRSASFMDYRFRPLAFGKSQREPRDITAMANQSVTAYIPQFLRLSLAFSKSSRQLVYELL